MGLFKFYEYDNCIFCDGLLPPKVERLKYDGEHVFPRNIKGFFKSRDVCAKCIQHFGKEIDKLPLKNYEILDAMKILGLSDKDYIDGQEFAGQDLFNKTSLDFVVDKKGPRIKNIKTENFFQTSEEKFDTIGIDWIRKDLSKRFDKDTLDKELDKIKENYKNAKYGEKVSSEKLGFYVNKSQAEIIKAKDNSVPLHKLVAKIAVIFLNYVLSPQEVLLIREYNKIKDFAMDKVDIIDNTIYRSKLFKDNNYKKYHIAKIENYGKFIIIEIIFFGRISYSLPLTSSEKINLIVGCEDEPLKGLALVLDFEDKYKTFLEYKNQNNEFGVREFSM